jgi:hypothetical protein
MKYNHIKIKSVDKKIHILLFFFSLIYDLYESQIATYSFSKNPRVRIIFLNLSVPRKKSLLITVLESTL